MLQFTLLNELPSVFSEYKGSHMNAIDDIALPQRMEGTLFFSFFLFGIFLKAKYCWLKLSLKLCNMLPQSLLR